MAKTTYVCRDAVGNTVKTFTKRQRAVDEYDADSTKTITCVVAMPSGKLLIGELTEPTVKETKKQSKPKPAAKPAADDGEAAAKLRSRRHLLMERDRDAVLKNAPVEKRCGRCKETRGRHDFNVDLSIEDGLRAWCKLCYKEYAAARKAKLAAAKVAAA